MSTVEIPQYNGRYLINEDAEIIRIYKTKKVKMSVRLKKGHPVVQLTDKNGIRKMFKVSTLMKIAFYKCDNPLISLYHKDGMKSNCSLINLKPLDKKTLGKITGHTSRSKNVCKLNNGEIIEFYKSARETARKNHMSYQTVIDRCNGKVKSKLAPDGYEYIWEENYKY